MLNSNLTLVLFTDDANIPTLDSRLDEWITLAKKFWFRFAFAVFEWTKFSQSILGKNIKTVATDVRQAIKANAGHAELRRA